MRMQLNVSFAVLVVVTLAARETCAKEEFVDIIASHLSLSYAPPCRVCHIQGTTGPGSVQTPFGMSMLAHGLTEGEGTVPIALDGVAADRSDSDGDGVADVDELRANRDPNTAADVTLGEDGRGSPRYGCAVAPEQPLRWGAPAVLTVALAALMWSRRRRTPVAARSSSR